MTDVGGFSGPPSGGGGGWGASVGGCSLRLALPGELSLMLEIDDAASMLYHQAGLNFDLAKDHPLVVEECSRWDRAIHANLAYFALDQTGTPVGFMTLGYVDGAPYLDQLSVHPRAMRRGIGTQLMAQAFLFGAEQAELWLTTYAHLPWNRPYYERHGFEVIPEETCGAELRRVLASQRAGLPDPEQRVAMRRRCK